MEENSLKVWRVMYILHTSINKFIEWMESKYYTALKRGNLLSHVWLFVNPWLLCPWNSPGKNIGVGCHFLLQGIFLPRDRTCVSFITGRFHTIWATRKAPLYSPNNHQMQIWICISTFPPKMLEQCEGGQRFSGIISRKINNEKKHFRNLVIVVDLCLWHQLYYWVSTGHKDA